MRREKLKEGRRGLKGSTCEVEKRSSRKKEKKGLKGRIRNVEVNGDS